MNELKSRDDEIGKLKQEMARLKTMREAVQRKLQNSEEARVEIEQKRDTLKSQLIALEKVFHLTFSYQVLLPHLAKCCPNSAYS